MIYESGENYLETIYMLINRNGSVRSIDIACELGYSKASISRAMSILKKNSYITIDTKGFIYLTEKGQEIAKDIYERHEIITKFLVQELGVKPEIADNDACRIEHVISAETFNKIKNKVG